MIVHWFGGFLFFNDYSFSFSLAHDWIGLILCQLYVTWPLSVCVLSARLQTEADALLMPVKDLYKAFVYFLMSFGINMALS